MEEDPSASEQGSRLESRVLRALTAADLDELLRAQAEGAAEGLGHIFPQEQYPFPVQAVRSRWERELDDPDMDCFVVLDAAGAVSGFVATRGNEFLHFGTALRTWGTGLAGLAHDEVLAHLSAQGYDHAWLRVFEANERARRFYSRRGWVPTGERSESGFPPNPVLLHYRIDLGAAPQ
jgi:RimJ/RimL family protein N-acetyltransferase